MLTVSVSAKGVDFSEGQVGDEVRVSEAFLAIIQLGKECHDRCAIFHQLGDCVMPREGVFARVLQGGVISAGDVVQVMHAEGN